MAEEIVAADGDDRVARMDRAYEIRRRSVRRSMMTDFEDFRALNDKYLI